MKLRVLVVAISAVAVLAGCDQVLPTKRPVQNGLVATPALPIIKEAIHSLSPTFNGKRVPVLVNQLCALAQGQVTPEQNRTQLAALGLAPDKIDQKGRDALALLVNGDRAAQATACAAYLASSALVPLNPQELMRDVPPKAKVAEKPAQEEKGHASKDRAESPTVAAAQPTREIDPQALNRFLPLRLAHARADADIFAYIAQRLSEQPGLSVAQYGDQARQLFASLAPSYLKLVQQHLPAPSATLRLNQLDGFNLSFDSDEGTRYSATSFGGMTLEQDGQMWLGRGLIQGTDYRVQAAFVAPPATKAIAAQ
ncbi:hypothetical protein ACQCLI_10850 [Pseudomonas nitroreducens]|uniref:hypothetical protein n=1 Tax=Pseudomonas TaxID=286 RepID=UPI00030A8AC8|nr:hypothetical protein [Pseudomonas nitroreducens]